MDRHIVHSDIEAYVAGLYSASSGVLAEMEALAGEQRFPIVGPQVGRLLGLLARAVGARQVCELGSGFGYSTVYFAEAVGREGRVLHTEFSAERSAQARAFLERAGLAPRVDFRVGDALATLESESGPYDIIFCDVDKEAYPRVPNLALPRLRSGGLLIFDNTLWHGRVPDDDSGEPSTTAVRALNSDLALRPGIITSVLPLRDGVSVCLKL